MTTFVGTQNDFKSALESLIELEYDALSAYHTAIEALEKPSYKLQLRNFAEDHQRHIDELSHLFRRKGFQPPTKPATLKHLLTKGKAVLATLGSDISILQAMLSNEKDTNHAYETMLAHEEIWLEATPIIRRGLEDEKRHKNWLEMTLIIENQ